MDGRSAPIDNGNGRSCAMQSVVHPPCHWLKSQSASRAAKRAEPTLPDPKITPPQVAETLLDAATTSRRDEAPRHPHGTLYEPFGAGQQVGSGGVKKKT